MLGGKGGFGAELRLQSKKRGPKPVTNFGAVEIYLVEGLDMLMMHPDSKISGSKSERRKFDPTTEKTNRVLKVGF